MNKNIQKRLDSLMNHISGNKKLAVSIHHNNKIVADYNGNLMRPSASVGKIAIVYATFHLQKMLNRISRNGMNIDDYITELSKKIPSIMKNGRKWKPDIKWMFKVINNQVVLTENTNISLRKLNEGGTDGINMLQRSLGTYTQYCLQQVLKDEDDKKFIVNKIFYEKIFIRPGYSQYISSNATVNLFNRMYKDLSHPVPGERRPMLHLKTYNKDTKNYGYGCFAGKQNENISSMVTFSKCGYIPGHPVCNDVYRYNNGVIVCMLTNYFGVAGNMSKNYLELQSKIHSLIFT